MSSSPDRVTTCRHCGARYEWSSGDNYLFNNPGQTVPSCPSCGGGNDAPLSGDVAQLVKQLGSGDGDTRNRAAAALGNTGSKDAVVPLLKALKDGDTRVVFPAIVALGKIGDPRAIDGLGAAARRGVHYGPARSAARALCDIGTKRAFEVAASCAQGLGVYRDELLHRMAEVAGPAIDALVGLLRRQEPDLRAQAAWELGWSGEKRALAPLLELLGDPEADVREAAEVACVKLGWQPEDPTKHVRLYVKLKRWDQLQKMGEAAIEALLELLHSDDDDERASAITALRTYAQQVGPDQFGPAGDAAIEALTELLYGQDQEERASARSALDSLGWQPPPEHYLAAALARKKSRGQLETISPEVVEAMIAALEDPHYRFRAAALEILTERGHDLPIPLLGRLLAEGDSSLAWKAGQALRAAEGEEASQVLIDALAAGTGIERSVAAVELGRRRCSAAVEPLIEALTCADTSVVNSAASALGEIGDERAIEPLASLLGSDARELVLSVAQALAGLRDERGVASLIGLLDDVGAASDGDFARKVTAALVSIHSDAAAVALAEAVADKAKLDFYHRKEVIEQLGELKAEPACDALLKVVRNRQADGRDEDIIRNCAARAIEQITGVAPKNSDTAKPGCCVGCMLPILLLYARALLSLGRAGMVALWVAVVLMLAAGIWGLVVVIRNDY